jgi:hypothetical protein
VSGLAMMPAGGLLLLCSISILCFASHASAFCVDSGCVLQSDCPKGYICVRHVGQCCTGVCGDTCFTSLDCSSGCPACKDLQCVQGGHDSPSRCHSSSLASQVPVGTRAQVTMNAGHVHIADRRVSAAWVREAIRPYTIGRALIVCRHLRRPMRWLL